MPKWRPKPLCPACRAKAARLLEVQEAETRHRSLAFHRQQWLEECGLQEKYRRCTFDGDPCCNAQGIPFDPAGNEPRIERITQYIANFPVGSPPKGYPSLLITSANNGTGKTHSAAAVLRSIIMRFDQIGRERCPYQFWTAAGIKHRVYDAQRFGGPETVADVYADFASMWLLVLDDIGKERKTAADIAATYETYYTIINERYNRGLPVVITSNLGFEPWMAGGMTLEDVVGLAGVSRLREMTGAVEITMQGRDWR